MAPLLLRHVLRFSFLPTGSSPRGLRHIRTRVQQTIPMKPQPSHRIGLGERGEIPGDLGLLPETFVMPTGKNLPSVFTSPKERLRVEFTRLKRRFFDLRELIGYRFLAKTKVRPFEPRRIAKSLHKDMYTAFAERDVETLRHICGDGLLASFKKRLLSRGPSRVEWKLHKYVRPIRIVSNKAGSYPGLSLHRRQAVVRIRSIQSLTKYTSQGSVVAGTGEPKEVVEYLVLEKKKMGGRETPWFVWGTTTETKLAENE